VRNAASIHMAQNRNHERDVDVTFGFNKHDDLLDQVNYFSTRIMFHSVIFFCYCFFIRDKNTYLYSLFEADCIMSITVSVSGILYTTFLINFHIK
jgi:hypothetical protein